MSDPVKDAAEQRASRRLWRPLFAAISVAYLYFIPYFPALNNPNENSRIYQIRAVVELGKYSVNEQVQRFGWVNDLAVRNGLYITGKAPGTTFVGVPVYAALRTAYRVAGRGEVPPLALLYALRLFGTLLPSLAFVWWFRAWIRRVVCDEHMSNVLAITLALGTLFLPSAMLFVNHSLTAATAFGSVLAVEAAEPWGGVTLRHAWRRPRTLLLVITAGALVSMTAALDYALFPVACVLLAYVPWRLGWRSLPVACVGALGPAALTASYHQACWGSPFGLSVSHLANPQFAKEQSQGLFGFIGPSTGRAWDILFSAHKGLVFFSPVSGLGLVCVVVAAFSSRRSKLAALCFFVVGWMLLFNISLSNWLGGWSVGPRYVTVVAPFVIGSIALVWAELGARARRWGLPAFVGLAIASIVVTTPASVVFPHLQPEYANPVFEVIWPLWRDAFTPHSLARWAFGLEGRGAQLAYVLVLVALLLYLVWIVGRTWAGPPRAWRASWLAACAAVAIAAACLWTESRAAGTDRNLARAGQSWLRTQIWEPRLPRSQPSGVPGARGQ